MTVDVLHERRVDEVWRCLDTVTDPELDESVTSLGFIEHVTVADDGAVAIGFRLPTYWCSPNFAFLMADDMRRAVERLPWVTRVRPQLRDHMSATEINAGVAEGLSFDQAFRELAAGDRLDSLDALREQFRRKAFERRQEAVLVAFQRAGMSAGAICAMRLAAFDGAVVGPSAEEKRRYREALLQRGVSGDPEDRAFVTGEGEPIDEGRLGEYLRRLRGVRINMEFASALCRGLLDARCQRGCGGTGCRSSVCGGHHAGESAPVSAPASGANPSPLGGSPWPK